MLKQSLMHILLQKTQLLQSLQRVSRFVSTKPQLPILSSIAVETTEHGIQLSATDLQVGIREQLAGQVLEPGQCAVPAKLFQEVITSVEEEQIELTLDQLSLQIKAGSLLVKISCFPLEDFPPFPAKEGQELEIPLTFLVEASQSVLFAASSDETRPILTSTLLQFDSESKMVATDGFRLAVFTSQTPNVSPVKLLLPAKSLQEVIKILATESAQVARIQLSEGLKQAFFSMENIEIVLRTLDGDFPNYQKIIPEGFEIEVKCSRQKLEKMIKTAMIFSKDSSGIVKFSIEGTSLKVSARSTSLGEYSGDMDIENTSGKSNYIAFNGRYLIDFIQRIKDEYVIFKMNEPLKAAMFGLATSQELEYLVMPFRLTE